MKKIIDKKYNTSISFDALSYHLKKLGKSGYTSIFNNVRKRGQKAYYCLTDKTKQEIDIGILELDYDRSYLQLENIKENKMWVYYQILCIIAIKPALSVYNPEDKPGVTIKDLVEGLSGMIGFWHVRLNEQKINNALSYLEKKEL